MGTMDYDGAEKLFTETLQDAKRLPGTHPGVLDSMESLAETFSRRDRFEEAAVRHGWSLKIHRELLGDEHPKTISCMINLAGCLVREGSFAESSHSPRNILNQVFSRHELTLGGRRLAHDAVELMLLALGEESTTGCRRTNIEWFLDDLLSDDGVEEKVGEWRWPGIHRPARRSPKPRGPSDTLWAGSTD